MHAFCFGNVLLLGTATSLSPRESQCVLSWQHCAKTLQRLSCCTSKSMTLDALGRTCVGGLRSR